MDGDRLSSSVDGDTQRSSGTPRLVCKNGEGGVIGGWGDAVVALTDDIAEGEGELERVRRCSRSLAGLVRSSKV